MSDPAFDQIRREEAAALALSAADRPTLETRHGRVWDTDELRRDFEVLGYLAPYVVVRRRSDGIRGSLQFQADPRFYFAFEEDRP